MVKQTYKVLRPHIGDRNYLPGDERTADAAEVQHLVKNGVLEAAKAEDAPKNKAAAAVKNKAVTKPKMKVAPASKNKVAPAAENKDVVNDPQT